MLLHFTKMEGCGNDYVYVNGFAEKLPQEEKPELVSRIADRHFGVGGDGVIFINPGMTAPFEMEMYNMDGSRGEMCGNGMRCVAAYLYDRGIAAGVEFEVESAGQKHPVQVFPGEDGRARSVRVNMGAPVLAPERIPVILPAAELLGSEPGGAGTGGKVFVIAEPIMVLGESYEITCVSMGNPHAVVFLPEDVSLADFDIMRIGPAFESDPHFPNKTNTEFVRPVDESHVELRVWERGSGETLACGTGCCAAAVAGALNGVTGNRVHVRVPGGELFIEWDREADEVFMTGPVRTVFEGTLETENFR
nr:diaminopimelate epimerase [Lachnoclostridium sp. Marseille-P6806]